MSKDVVGRNRLKDYICTSCGQIVSEYVQRMTAHMRGEISSQTCWECSFWLYTARFPKEHFQVINNQYFSFPPEIKIGGRVRHILTTEGLIISSTEYFNYGFIPERFAHLFPTTANFINGTFLRKLKANHGFNCKRLGCWDRLHCLWFNEANKNWNVIPKDHVIGNEECPMFINKLNPND